MDDSQKKDFIQALSHDTAVLSRLDLIIDHFLMEMDMMEGSSSDYTNSAWPFKAADRAGRRRAFKMIKELIGPVAHGDKV